jgi:hypothetical protein
MFFDITVSPTSMSRLPPSSCQAARCESARYWHPTRTNAQVTQK